MAFKFYIDGVLVDSPVNDQQPSTTIRRDNTIGGMVVTQDAELTWNANNDLEAGVASGFTLLKDAYDAGICEEMTFTIRDQVDATTNELLYVGVIKVPVISIDYQRQNATVRIQDNNFYSYINNNKSIEYNVQSVKTKNRVDITPPSIEDVDFFVSTTGVYGGSFGYIWHGYRVYEVFRYIVAAISDNKIGFESLFLQQEPELFIFDGYALANPGADPNVITSFDKLFKEVYKLRKIAFYIDGTDQDNPILRIESEDDIFSPVQVLSFEDIKEMISRIKTDKVYGSVRVGASDNPGGSAAVYTFESGISYLGWTEEVYTPLGQCNIDNELNLVNDYGITSNDIHDQVVGAVNSDLDKMFLVECERVNDPSFSALAKRYDSWIGTPEFYYNQGTNNPTKLIIHGSNYQTGLTNTLQIGSNGFRASRGQDQTIANNNTSFGVIGETVEPVIFTDETTGSNYDGNGNYNNVAGNYTTPIEGTYSFNARLNIDTINFPTGCTNFQVKIDSSPIATIPAGTYVPLGGGVWGSIITLTIEAYTDNTYTTLITSQSTISTIYENQSTNVTTTLTAFLPVGAEVRVKVNTQTGRFAFGLLVNVSTGTTTSTPLPNPFIEYLNSITGWQITVNNCYIPLNAAKPSVIALEDSYFENTGAPDGGGVLVENDPRLFRAKEFEFDYNISQSDWLQIKLNPIGQFAFEKDGVIRYGWIDTMKRNDWTGQTNIKLISDNAIIP